MFASDVGSDYGDELMMCLAFEAPLLVRASRCARDFFRACFPIHE
jgi:hypothetical protein